MRPFLLLAALSFLCGVCLQAQTGSPVPSGSSVPRDPQAVALLQQAVASMAPTPPADSTATGSVTITAGSQTTQGTVSILTKGTAETSIQFQIPNSTWSIIFANGEANRVESGTTTSLPLELAASSQCFYFPQPYLSGLLNNPDFSLQLVGQELVGSSSANHIHVQNTFTSSPAYQFLSEFNTVDIWLDATSALPVKIAMIRRYTGGFSPQIPISFTYSNYQSVSGVRYPFTIQEYVTQTLWATTTIRAVNLNTGLTDANFPIIQGSN